MDLKEFVAIIAALEVGAAVGKDRLRAFYREAGRRGINLIRPGTFAQPVTAAAESVGPSLARRVGGTLARRSPYIVGGAALAEAARRTPDLIEDVIDQWDRAQEALGVPTKMRTKRKTSKFNKAISAGMKAVKKSKSFGKPGKFSNSKKAFAAVTKTVSGLKKGRKAPKKGVRATIARAVRTYI